jgi:uncharacterized protein
VLEMRDKCERCGRALTADGPAVICSYECTFCPDCARELEHRCPNCGGALMTRPPRLTAARQSEASIDP